MLFGKETKTKRNQVIKKVFRNIEIICISCISNKYTTFYTLKIPKIFARINNNDRMMIFYCVVR